MKDKKDKGGKRHKKVRRSQRWMNRQGTSPQYQNRYLDLVVWYCICQTQPNYIQLVRRRCCLGMKCDRDETRRDKDKDKDKWQTRDKRQQTTEAKETKQGFGKHYHSVRAGESKRVTAIYHLKIFNTTYPMSWEGGQYLLKEWPGCDGGMWYLA